VLFGVSLVAFSAARLAGDPGEDYARRVSGNPTPSVEQTEAARDALGLDRPVLAQYRRWLGSAASGDLGASYLTLAPVASELRHRLPISLELVVPSFALALFLGVPLGTLAAMHRSRWADHLLRLTCLTVASVPGFWLAILLIDLFAVRLHLLPITASQGSGAVVLPALTLGLPMAAWLARFTRSSMLRTMEDDYVRTALAKGVRRDVVMERHVLRNALVPLVTVLGTTAARLLSGAAIIETIFAWPGLGALAVDAVQRADFPVIQAFVLYTGVVFVAVNLVVDLACAAIDPRIRLTGPVAA
jgi:ABC-type dipeptide/oligopeptide/nickel transport system permease component